MNGVAGKAIAAYNDQLYVQHCVTHTEVLMSKDAQKQIPGFVEKTIKEVLDYFHYSAVRRARFEDIAQELKSLTDDDGVYKSLIRYHKVRWLSLEHCVRRLEDMMTTVCQCLQTTANDMSVKAPDRRAAQKLYDKVADPEFQLYLHFLRDQLPLLGDINRELQKKKQVITTTYRSMVRFMRAFVSPILIDDTLPLEKLMEHENLIEITRHDLHDPPPYGGTKFRAQWQECIEHGHLSMRKLQVVCSNCMTYITTVGRSFLKRFPEVSFVLNMCEFLEPEKRKVRMDDKVREAVGRFNNNFFDVHEVLRSYTLYRLDDSLDAEYMKEQDPVKFFCYLYSLPGDHYRPFATLCILLLTIQPDVCDIERGFSTMNYLKNKYRTRLTQEHLNAAVAISLDGRDETSFLFDKCLKR